MTLKNDLINVPKKLTLNNILICVTYKTKISNEIQACVANKSKIE